MNNQEKVGHDLTDNDNRYLLPIIQRLSTFLGLAETSSVRPGGTYQNHRKERKVISC
jgi:hypothetical protein